LILSKYPAKEEIIYLKSNSNYTIYYLQNGETFISSKTLKQTETNLQLMSFLRVNKSYLLNPDFINNISKEGNKITVKLKNGTQVSVSRRKVIALKQKLKKFFK
jgi:two-component system LytT family response regulator